MDRVPVFGTGGEGSNPSTSAYFIPILICTFDRQKIKKNFIILTLIIINSIIINNC